MPRPGLCPLALAASKTLKARSRQANNGLSGSLTFGGGGGYLSVAELPQPPVIPGTTFFSRPDLSVRDQLFSIDINILSDVRDFPESGSLD
jgi:hypothetical protein